MLPSACTSTTASVVELTFDPKLTEKLDESLEQPSESQSAAEGDVVSPPAPYPQWLKIVLLIAFSIASFLDVAGISTLFSAVPVLSADLGLTGNQGVWLLSAYQLTLSSFLLLAGRMTDIYNPSISTFPQCILDLVADTFDISEHLFTIGLVGLGLFSLIAGFLRDKIGIIILRAISGICM